MAKKRKGTPQPVTLHDFFGKPANSSANKKPKLHNVDKKVKVKRERLQVDPKEIIVIESDEETADAVVAPPDRCSSDVEIVDGPSIDFQRKNRVKWFIYPPPNEDKEREKRNLMQDAVVKDSPFGEPSALLRSRTPPARVEYEDTNFGAPSILLADELPLCSTENFESSQAGKLRSSAHTLDEDAPVDQTESYDGSNLPAHSRQANSSSHIQDVTEVEETLPIDEEWGTGDDEMDLAGDRGTFLSDSQEDVDIDLTLDDDQPLQDETCPVCGKLLLKMQAMDIQEHVNQCIDATSSSDAPIASTSDRPSPVALDSSSSKPLRPVLSFQSPTCTSIPSAEVKQRSNPPFPRTKDSDAFSILMTSHQENEAWKEASVAEDRNFRPTKGNGGRRKAPFYKVLNGMPIAVDAFRYGTIPGITAYFLTHAHSDHYTNLSSNWKSGPIYCSEGTANLIIHMLSVDPKWVHPFPMDIATVIPDTGGVRVTLIEANHCPGSCLFLFEGPQTVNAGDSAFKSSFVGSSRIFRYLHCGDFRASPQHVMHPAVRGNRIDHVYLDTTYLDPKYCFPPQPQVISACAELAKRIVTGQGAQNDESGQAKMTRKMTGWFTKPEKLKEKETTNSGKTLVVVGTYSIGKERIVKAIAKALETKIYCDSRKAAILRCQSDPELHDLLSKDPLEAGVHLVPLGAIASDKLKIYIERWKGSFTKVVGFRPTGWTYTQPSGSDLLPSIPSVITRSQSRTFTHVNLTPMKNSTSSLQVYGVPYSEHSSFFELTCFALSFDWGRMIATVNVGSESSRGKMAKWVEKWEAERKKANKVEVVRHRAPDYW